MAALDGVDLAVPGGAITCLLGPNGAGKSTLLRVLATLLRPDGGRATVAGLDLLSQPDGVRQRIGYLADEPMHFGELTVEENVRLQARLHGMALPEERLTEVLSTAGLSRRRRARARTLSRGLAQRLAIVLASVHSPDVLLLDEPHAGLDPTAALDLDLLLRRLAARGHAVLLTSHDPAHSLELADHVAVLNRGRVTWWAATGDVTEDMLEAAYGSSPVTRDPDKPLLRVAAATPAPVDSGPSFVDSVGALLWKDALVELRSREVVPPVLVFALLMTVVFQFALPPNAAARQSLAAGALWVSLLFGSTLGLSRLVATDVEAGSAQWLLVSPTDRGALFVGKWLAGFLFSVLVAALLLPAFVALLGIRVTAPTLAALAGVVALALVGWVAAGVLLAAVAASVRGREVLLPVLLYPLVLPLVVPAVQATGALLQAGPVQSSALLLVGAYDVVFLVLGFLLFGRALEQ